MMTTPAPTVSNPYDQVPYSSFPYPESHPSRLRAIASLYGLEAPPAESARVLEIGCASGGNLLPIAAAFPGCRCAGVDLSSRQIEHAASTMRTLGLKNVELHAASITDIAPTLGTFDYIICHGVYSWVKDNVRSAILSICRDRLSPAGIAFISFNTYPGWHTRQWVREMMIFHGRQFKDEKQRVTEARAFVSIIADSPNIRTTPAAEVLKRESAELSNQRDDYILHEFFEEENVPFYMTQFAAHAAAHGLQYLADARLNGSPTEDAHPKLKTMLDQTRNDIVRFEQYLDYLRNRVFRRALLCREGLMLDRAAAPGRLRQFRLATLLSQTQAQPGGLASQSGFSFSHPRGQSLTVSQPLLRDVLVAIRKAYPRAIPFDEALAMARPNAAPSPGDSESLAQGMLPLWQINSLEIHRTPDAFTTDISERPTAWAYARHQAALGMTPTTLRHEVFPLDVSGRRLLALLDGSRTIGDLVTLISPSADGRPSAEKYVREALRQFAMAAVLVA